MTGRCLLLMLFLVYNSIPRSCVVLMVIAVKLNVVNIVSTHQLTQSTSMPV
jgi:hypothetical protein